jgi:hypothetical protein
MPEGDNRPERSDPADFYLRAMHAALAARAARFSLDAPNPSDQTLRAAQQVLREQALSALADEALFLRLWELELQARSSEPPGTASDERSTPLSGAQELIEDANRQSPYTRSRAGLWIPQRDTLAKGVDLHLKVFINQARPFANDPAPLVGDPGRHAWIQGLKAVLDKVVDILFNLAVAVAFTNPNVQRAAQQVTYTTVDVAGQTLTVAGQMWPSLVAAGTAAFQAAVGVSVAKQALASVRSARSEDAAVSDRINDHESARQASAPLRTLGDKPQANGEPSADRLTDAQRRDHWARKSQATESAVDQFKMRGAAGGRGNVARPPNGISQPPPATGGMDITED